MAEDEDRKGVAEWEGVYEAPFEVVIERVESDQTVRCTEYEGDEEDSPMHPDTTVFGEPYGIAGRPPKDVEYLTLESKSGRDWLVAADVDRPTVSAEGNTIVFDMYESGGEWVVGSKIELADDITIDPRTGQKVVTTKATYLGSASAAEALLKGTTLYNTFNQFLGTWLAHLATLKAASAQPEIDAYCDSVTTAIGTLQAAMGNWQSTLHKLDQ
jgi:hypothetical protein